MTNYDTIKEIAEREQRALDYLHSKANEKGACAIAYEKKIERRWRWLRYAIIFIALFAFIYVVISSFNN